LRLAVGNGLRGDIWETFAARFAIPRILECYAATEGNFSLFNVEGKPGAIGRIPPLLAHRFPASIVTVHADSGSPVRGDDGLCIACAPGEVGEAVGRIGTADQGGGPFEGYTDRAETEKKILRNVFADGDAWFRTGDLMLRDEQGYFHFVDRVGDTFRWKGENVATSEVNEAIRDCPGVLDASIYGSPSPAPTAAPAWRLWWWSKASISGSSPSTCRAGSRSTRFRSSSGSVGRSTLPIPSSRRSSG
jgi:fatty-acyl-CoA synthase